MRLSVAIWILSLPVSSALACADSRSELGGTPRTANSAAELAAILQDIRLHAEARLPDFQSPPVCSLDLGNALGDGEARSFPLSLAMLDDASVAEPSANSVAAGESDLAQKLSNPVASLISVPFQFNFDRGYGPDDDGHRFVLNIQPVIPISLSADWNLISRTIVPIVHQHDLFPGAGDETGLGDITQSFFFSPKEPTAGWIWGAGPVFLIPSATDDSLGSEKFGIGPTVVVLKQEHGFTYGALANHIWSVAGEDDRADVNATFMQPFLSYTTADAWTFTVNTESTYDWESSDWSVPINGIVFKLVRIGGQPIQFFAGVRYWAESPDNGPEGFGFRCGFTLLFPTG